MGIFKNKFKKSIVILCAIVVLIAYGLVYYNGKLSSHLTSSTETTMNEIIGQQKFNFDSEISADQKLIDSMAIAISFMPDNRELIWELITQTLDKTKFTFIAITNMDGIGIGNRNEVVDLSSYGFFKSIVKSDSVSTIPMDLVINGIKVIPISSTIYIDDKPMGVLTCAYPITKLDSLLLPSFDGQGYAFVIDSNGDILASTSNDYVLLENETNAFEAYEKVIFEEHDNLKTIIENVSQKKSGRIKYKFESDIRYAHYSPLTDNDWYVFTVIPEEVITADTQIVTQSVVFMAILIMIGFIVFIAYILVSQKKADNAKESYTLQLERVAYFDELTGLPNIHKFKLDAAKYIKKNANAQCIIAKFDIVNFKMVNEMFDFDTGDKIVQEIANQLLFLHDLLGVNNIIYFARINADEFILLDHSQTLSESEVKIRIFEEQFTNRIIPIIGTHKIQFRYGRYLIEPNELDITLIIEKANLAHRIAKTSKNSSIFDYNDSIKETMIKEVRIEARMNEGLANKEFKVYLQPKYSLTTEKIVGVEALVRWHVPNDPIIQPNDFIPLFERNGFIIKLDMYMFEQSCEIIRKWMDNGIPVVTISVNFSRLHLANSNFVEEINVIANKYRIPKKYLEIELTESTIFDNEEVLLNLLNKLHEIGFTLSMDDFGSGYSSLGLLKNLPVDVIKIDRRFFSSSNNKAREKTVIESVIQMAKKLSIQTVAEGVETQEHVDLLKEIGCDTVQGYYYAKPMPEKDFPYVTK